MRILVAGAGGAVGRVLLPALVAAGHDVIGMTRSPAKKSLIESLGAEAASADALDAEAVLKTVSASRPEVIVEQLTALPAKVNPRHFEQETAATNLLRKNGTDNLVQAGLKVGVRRIVAQSFAGVTYVREGGPAKTEQDPLDPNPPKPFRQVLEAVRHLEDRVTKTPGIQGLALRYAFFYGPEESSGGLGAIGPDVRSRKMPIVGSGAGVWSFVHLDDVASATLAAVERGHPGIYNVADDEPAPVSVWLPELARIVGAKSPFHLPAWLARFAIGEPGVILMTEIRGALNGKAKRELGWKLKFPSWREGFAKVFRSNAAPR